MGEDLVDHQRLGDERDDPHGPATRRTRERVDLKDPLQKRRPAAGDLGRREAWRNQPKWVVSRSLLSVGPNARLVAGDLAGAIRALKSDRPGEIEVAGPALARSLTELGLIDEYRIYLHPVVIGHGTRYLAAAPTDDE